MDCEQALAAISARLDGELSEAESRELDAHLASCASCRALAKELTELEAGLDLLPIEEAPDTLVPGVMRAIRAEKSQRSQKKKAPHRTAWLIAAAAAIALLLGAAGIIELPGFRGRGHASVSVGDAFKTQQTAEEYAAQLAEERGCAVLLIRDCPDGIEALNGATKCAPPHDDMWFYTVPVEVMDAVMTAWGQVYPMEVYAPQEQPAQETGTACILICP